MHVNGLITRDNIGFQGRLSLPQKKCVKHDNCLIHHEYLALKSERLLFRLWKGC